MRRFKREPALKSTVLDDRKRLRPIDRHHPLGHRTPRMLLQQVPLLNQDSRSSAAAPAVTCVTPCGNSRLVETVRIFQRSDSFLYSRAFDRSQSLTLPTSRPLRPGTLAASSYTEAPGFFGILPSRCAILTGDRAAHARIDDTAATDSELRRNWRR